MKLIRLQIARHLSLRDLDLRFDRPARLDNQNFATKWIGAYTLDFIVGVNGSGKSTVLRVLAQIITDLYAGRTSEFDYSLQYELGVDESRRLVEVSQSHGDQGISTHMRVQELAQPQNRLLYDAETIDTNFLPKNVVIYTTGNEAEWERALGRRAAILEQASSSSVDDPIQLAIRELPSELERAPIAETDSEQQPYLLVRGSRLPLVALCGLLTQIAKGASYLSEVLEEIGLARVNGFSLRFRLHRALSPFDTFNRLLTYSPKQIQQGTDHLLVFDLTNGSQERANALIKEFGSGLNLFQALDELLAPTEAGQPTLQQVNLFLERKAPPESEDKETEDAVSRVFLLDWLSDGEASFLGRMALLAMLDTNDSLILLDEPEVHFNDFWKRKIVALLDAMMKSYNNHVIIVTHSSISLSDVMEGQVSVLTRDPAGATRRRETGLRTFGTDPAEIMVVVFGTGLAIGEYSTMVLQDVVTEGDKGQVAGFIERVGPGMWRFRLRQRLEEPDAPPA